MSEYFYRNRHNILGELTQSTLYAARRLGVDGPAENIPENILTVTTNWEPRYSSIAQVEALTIPPELQQLPDYCYSEWDGKIYQRRDGCLYPVKTQEVPRIQAMLGLHQVLDQLLAAQTEGSNNLLRLLQQNLGRTYQEFTRRYGVLNAKDNIRALGQDLRYYSLRALELPQGKGWKRADIFTQRVAQPEQGITQVETPADALLHCLNLKGRVDLDFICALLEGAE
jgi:hypothetical protein